MSKESKSLTPELFAVYSVVIFGLGTMFGALTVLNGW